MAMVYKKFVAFTKKYPMVKGMLTYSILWPASNLCQQLVQGSEHIDWTEAATFSLYGTFYDAPSCYIWVKTAGHIFPGQSLRIAIMKAITEQAVFSPFAISSFYLGTSLLEGKTLMESYDELRSKFLPTYKTGMCIWPIVQTVNFAFVNERNRVSVTGVVSFFWTVFLSYTKHGSLHAEATR